MNLSSADYREIIARQRMPRGAVQVVAQPSPCRRRQQPNQWEREYAAHLALRQRAGEIELFRFWPVRLKLADGLHYTPDFLVITWQTTAVSPMAQRGSQRIEFHEVKKTNDYKVDREGVAKFKTAGELFPFWRFVMVTKKSGEWVVTREAGAT